MRKSPGQTGPPPAAAPATVRIHYLRPPDRIQIFDQELVHDDGRVMITHARALRMERPLRVRGEVVLEPGSDAVWFTFPGAWYDIGRFHRADGTFTGVYANILEPCVFAPGEWWTTDLFLDLWIPAEEFGAARAGATPILLDEDELAEAERKGWVTPEIAARARAEVERLVREAAAGRWPPPVVREWTLARVRGKS